MLRNYLTTAFRNLIRNKAYSFINICGLSVGMLVTMLIGLWIWDELSFNTYHKNYDSIAQVWGGNINPQSSAVEGSFDLQYPVGTTLQENYPHYFKSVAMAFEAGDYTVATADKKFSQKGQFIQESALEMLSLNMLQGNYQSLRDPYSVVLSQSTAKTIFGNEDPMHKRLRIDNLLEVTVTGVYADIPQNSQFSEISFFLPWPLLVSYADWMKESATDWDNRTVKVYVQLQPTTNLAAANAAIKNLYYQHVPKDFFKTMEKNKPFVQLIPMSSWHLYSEFENGKPAGGRITYVWLFGIVGVFVLLLACINFINLSTARSSTRAKEVGVRKAIGAGKKQLIRQFLSESYLVVVMAFAIALLLLWFVQQPFNQLADKNIAFPFSNLAFWGISLLFILLTGCVAGLYPALYLSSFQPVKVLKGVIKSGRTATLPRKVMVVVQFTVSVVLISGTLVVYGQIQHARNRPIGYDKQNLLTLDMSDPSFKGKQKVLQTELMRSGVVAQVASSSSPVTAVWNITGGYEWLGKDPTLDAAFARCKITPEYGKTVSWEVVAGRDFSSALASDSTDAIIINQAAVQYMGFTDPIGQKLTDVDETGEKKWTKTIIGVVKNMVMESPFQPVQPTIYFIDAEDASKVLHIKINPAVSASVALPKIEAIFKNIVPAALFDYKFVDEEYAQKFSQEERIGTLAGLFSVIAIFISCLGLFGLASFVAEQRTKEFGIRKVLGASVSNLWYMQIKEFAALVLLACLIAIPISHLVMRNWLAKYEYHTEITPVFIILPCVGALAITILTVSYQAIKAALMNPVKSLRSE
ncbi:ABC transporter permease [Adhaeribacter rhizoryzae]|uniref:FtsX-like permease family protein n=1 Tax=Adhaeribacter rhizoryzae TaxID=2607907 RepID=A0A5M6D5W2_9BACT|nr:ABC transporter permease [Adhaeribacter rhizoryzae]KAA5541189.1 FtsX-like permease family protein [Adhaeribacter rhizoryzae]